MLPPVFVISLSPIGLSIVPWNTMSADVVPVIVINVGKATCSRSALMVTVDALRLTVGLAKLSTIMLSSCSGRVELLMTVTFS